MGTPLGSAKRFTLQCPFCGTVMAQPTMDQMGKEYRCTNCRSKL